MSHTLCSSVESREREREDINLHSVAGDYLVSVFVPGHEGSGEGSQRRRADDGCSPLSHRLSLLLSREVPQDCKRRGEEECIKLHLARKDVNESD